MKRDAKTSQIQKPSRKSVAPRFVSPITGMIVDQEADVVLEGIIDGEYIVKLWYLITLIPGFSQASYLNFKILIDLF